MAVIAFLFGLALAAAVVALGALLEAFVLVSIWTWFVVPTFQLPALTYPVAIGIAAMVGLMTRQFSPSVKGDSKERLTQAFLAPVSVLLVGWVAKQFI